ncbi:hypothetical protein ACHAW6_015437 [Cyclotella cf. meneghiniana]
MKSSFPESKLRIVSISYVCALILPRVFSFLSVPSTRRQSSYPNCRLSFNLELSPTSSIPIQWKPCAQPRFDEFASCTVGPWIPATRSDSGSGDASSEICEVEEVMRSCGGAIQGIRELPLSLVFPDSNNIDLEQRTYHNRADGGFVYADDGSYSAGPEEWEFERNVNSDDVDHSRLCMASLSFGKHRLWLAATLDSLSAARNHFEANLDGNVDGPAKLSNASILELSRPSIAGIHMPTQQLVDINTTQIPEITWRSIQRVRMPSHSQVWSLARAKWEKTTFTSDNLDDDPTNNESSIQAQARGTIVGCVQVELISSDTCKLFGDLIDHGYIIEMLGVCMQSKSARSTMRCFDKSGHLKSVAFLCGTIL